MGVAPVVGDVAARLRDGDHPSDVRVEVALAPVAVGGKGNAGARSLDAQDGGVSAGGDNGVGLDLVVVLAVDGQLGRDIGGSEQAQEDGGGRHLGHGDLVEVEVLRVREPLGFLAREPVGGRVGQESDGEASALRAVIADAHVAVCGGLADDGDVKVPLVEYPGDLAGVFRRDDDEHPLLALGEHDLVGRHSRLAPGDLRHVYADARPALARALDGRGGQPGGAQVLQADETTGPGQFHARLDQHFFEEGVAHLHGGAQLAVVLEAPRGETRRAVNAVASRVGPDQHEEIARRARGGAEELVRRNDADAHGVHERVAGVGVGEDDLSADVGDADAVAVLRDARDHAAEEIAVPRGVGLSEAQGVEEGYRSSAHGEDVPDDTADSGCGSLIRLDCGGVIVRLDLHDDGEAVADVDRARVLLSGGDQHSRTGVGQHPEEGLGVLVRAVLAPQGTEEAKLQLVRLASETLDDGLVLPFGDGECFECLFAWGHVGPLRMFRVRPCRWSRGQHRPRQGRLR